jgi:hypothetical protein
LAGTRRLLEEFFTKQRIDALKDSIDALELRYNNYMNAPAPALLLSTFDQFTLALAASRNLNALSLPSTATIVNLGSSIHQEWIKTDRRQGVNLLNLLYDSCNITNNVVLGLIERHLKRFSEVTYFHFPLPGGSSIQGFGYTVDNGGIIEHMARTKEEAERIRNEHIHKEFAPYEKLIFGIRPIVSLWYALANNLVLKSPHIKKEVQSKGHPPFDPALESLTLSGKGWFPLWDTHIMRRDVQIPKPLSTWS